MGRIWAAAFALALALSPAAARAQRDPLAGQFGAVEIAPSPAEALQQVTLMSDALAALEPQRPGRLDVYVVAAALWSDPVFEREATRAAEILTEHFGAEGRSIVLTAGGGGPRRFAPSTPANIAAAIGRVGSIIDQNEDLVVVFITSHGGQDGAAAIRDGNRVVGALRPVHLSAMLSQANIRQRVVIVSSCFSGQFIAPLINDTTIVLTAAAPDRTSFGCQPENEWTYFGDALFNNALRSGAPLLEGFDQARTLIDRWERERNMTPPSNPQRYVGSRAADLVTRAERQAR